MTGEEVNEPVPEVLAGERLDRFVALRGDLTRAQAAELVAAGSVSVGGRPVTKAGRKLAVGETVSFAVPARRGPQLPAADASVPVPVVYEDDAIVVVNKPPGLVVHAGAGHPDATLVNGLLARYPEIAGVVDPRDPEGYLRPGIVHRLDGGTSGLMVVARTAEARSALVSMLAEREVGREYTALVEGHLATAAGMIDAPIGRSDRDATRQAVTAEGREALTHYEVVARYDLPVPLTLLRCRLETGRTHQIRVHLAAIGHPVCGDTRYGASAPVTAELALSRPFLHACQLTLVHPVSGEERTWQAPLPPDLAEVLARLDQLDQLGQHDDPVDEE